MKKVNIFTKIPSNISKSNNFESLVTVFEYKKYFNPIS